MWRLDSDAYDLTLVALGLSALGLGCASRSQGASRVGSVLAPSMAQVEYVRVAGQPCLQPQVTGGIPTDLDFVAAERRWLATNHPGYQLLNQEYWFTLATGAGGNTVRKPTDSIEFQTAEGRSGAECFALTVPNASESDK